MTPETRAILALRAQTAAKALRKSLALFDAAQAKLHADHETFRQAVEDLAKCRAAEIKAAAASIAADALKPVNSERRSRTSTKKRQESVWNEAKITLLKSLWHARPKIPLSAIGIELGVSANAVIGEAHRLGLPSRNPVAPYRNPTGQIERVIQKQHLRDAPPARLESQK